MAHVEPPLFALQLPARRGNAFHVYTHVCTYVCV